MMGQQELAERFNRLLVFTKALQANALVLAKQKMGVKVSDKEALSVAADVIKAVSDLHPDDLKPIDVAVLKSDAEAA